mmetsp:Transcript_59906/g.104792  ORF Transcript_59906/g.104792 Transcript_59906/m.104792 type:complete len:260 (-) Transcript_59906:2223-3002(-)
MPHKAARHLPGREAHRGLLRAELAGDLAQRLHLFFKRIAFPSEHLFRVWSNADTLMLDRREWQPLIKLLRHIRKHGMHQSQRPIKDYVKHLASNCSVFLVFICVLALHARFEQLKVNIAELVEKTIHSRRRVCKLVVLEALVCLLGASAEPGENPPVLEGILCVQAQRSSELEVAAEVLQAKSAALPHLVAELPVSYDAVHIQIHTPALQRICQQAEAKSIGTALRQTFRIVPLLTFFRPFDLLLRQVSFVELLVKIFQ